MAKLRHIALSVPDPVKAAEFYEKAFGMKRVGEAHVSIGHGVYLSDGTVNLALLRYTDDEAAGVERGKDWFGLHHFGFWVDDAATARKQVEDAGGTWFMGEPPTGDDDSFYEMKFRDPNGNIFDITHNGWSGARKDGPADEESPGD